MAALTPDPKTTKNSQVQLGALGISGVFILVGILGFVPGITSDFMDMGVAGMGSQAKLLGLFQVSILHNVVHLLFGVVGLLVSSTPLRARNFLLYGGIVYAVLFFYGIVVNYRSAANFVPFNGSDNVLHFLLAAAMIAMSAVLDRGPGWRELIEEGKTNI